tara:strand:+ start:14406 stop:14615 length:210 start_codon:yes stop_codon:yes gene_type:complete
MLIKESELRCIIKKVLIEEKIHQLPGYAKNKELGTCNDLTDRANDNLRDDVFDLIDQSYAYLGTVTEDQ